MSADTTVVIAARRNHDGELEYTAKCVQAAEDLFDPDRLVALDAAHNLFGGSGLPWFRGSQGLGAAKQLAGLIKDDLNRYGELEYQNQPIIEIADDGVHILSRKGNRKEKDADVPDWVRDGEARIPSASH